jgi:hypothetical protein
MTPGSMRRAEADRNDQLHRCARGQHCWRPRPYPLFHDGRAPLVAQTCVTCGAVRFVPAAGREWPAPAGAAASAPR